jgi:hypothetical protein
MGIAKTTILVKTTPGLMQPGPQIRGGAVDEIQLAVEGECCFPIPHPFRLLSRGPQLLPRLSSL